MSKERIAMMGKVVVSDEEEKKACPNKRPNLEVLKAAIKRCQNRMKKQYLQRVCISFRVSVGKVV